MLLVVWSRTFLPYSNTSALETEATSFWVQSHGLCIAAIFTPHCSHPPLVPQLVSSSQRADLCVGAALPSRASIELFIHWGRSRVYEIGDSTSVVSSRDSVSVEAAAFICRRLPSSVELCSSSVFAIIANSRASPLSTLVSADGGQTDGPVSVTVVYTRVGFRPLTQRTYTRREKSVMNFGSFRRPRETPDEVWPARQVCIAHCVASISDATH